MITSKTIVNAAATMIMVHRLGLVWESTGGGSDIGVLVLEGERSNYLTVRDVEVKINTSSVLFLLCIIVMV